MAAQGTCPDCGKRYKFRDDKVGKSIQCKECGGSIHVVGGETAFKAGGRTERIQVQAKLTSADRSDVVTAGLRGVTLLLLSLLLNLTSWIWSVVVFVSARWNESAGSPMPGYLTLASSVALVAGLVCWIGISSRIERRPVVLGALGVQVVVLLVRAVAVLRNDNTRLPDILESLLGTANWASFIMLTTVLQKLALFVDRPDLNDQAQDTIRFGVGVIFFGLLAGILPGGFLPGVGLIILFLIVASFVCMVLWIPNYARLLVWLRSAMAEARAS